MDELSEEDKLTVSRARKEKYFTQVRFRVTISDVKQKGLHL